MRSFSMKPLFRKVATRLHENHSSHLGIANTMRLARVYNGIKFRQQIKWRRAMYENQLSALLEENGPLTRPPIQIRDGWAIDTSMSLPHLNRVLEDSEKIIAERAGSRTTPKGAYRSFFQDVWTPADIEKYPSFLDFVTSSDVLSAVSHCLGFIPALSTTIPSGIRFVESNAQFDDHPNQPHDSQLHHIDYYSVPSVYVLVLLRDTAIENGPWTFLPRAASQEAAAKLEYWSRKCPFRLSDEKVYSVVDRKQIIQFCYPRGAVLFIEPSACFHYGSRNSVKPRFQLMLGYTGVRRTDFSELIMPPNVYPIRDNDSRLRKMVLNKNMLP
jgi:hypothetical protein